MKSTRKLLFGKSLLIAFISTITVTVLIVYITGLSIHRSLFENAIISLSILAIFLFLFLATGLYNGLNVLDNYSHKLQLHWKKGNKSMPEGFASDVLSNASIPDVGGDGIGGIIIGILLWIVFSIFLVVLLMLLQAVVWITILLFLIAIYWIMIRGLKLIFTKSSECENDLPNSMSYAFFYTLLYVGWIYVIIYATIIF